MKGSLSSVTEFEDYHEDVSVTLDNAFSMTCTIHQKPKDRYTRYRTNMTKEDWKNHETFLKNLFQTEDAYSDPRSKDNGWIELREIADKFDCMKILAAVIRYEMNINDHTIPLTPTIKSWIKIIFEFYEFATIVQ
jgi:hypothetical protein